MPIARISGHGLATIALAVASLWGLVIAERVTAQRVAAERVRVLHEIRLLQRRYRPEPVSAPIPVHHPTPRLVTS